MVCSKCGQRVADGVKICPVCKAEITLEEIIENDANEKNRDASFANETINDSVIKSMYPENNPAAAVGAGAITRKMYRATFTLVLAILSTSIVCLKFMANLLFNGEDTIAYILSRLSTFGNGYYEMIMDTISSLEETLEMISPGMSALQLYGSMIDVVNMISLIPAILYAVAIWICYVSAVSEKNDRPSNAGLHIIRIMTIISLALEVITVVLSDIILAAEGAMLNDSSVSNLFTGAIIGITLILVIPILYKIFIIISLNTMIKNVKDDTCSDRISVFVCCMLFLKAFSCIGAGATLLHTVINLMQGAIYVLFAIFLLNYRSAMRLAGGLKNTNGMR